MRCFVIGDLGLDCDIICEATRLSNEAPVPVLLQKKKVLRCGCAANVASAVAALGDTIWAAGRLGSCNEAQPLLDLMRRDNVRQDFVRYSSLFKTTTKTRLIDVRDDIHRVIARVDDENVASVEDGLTDYWLKSIAEADCHAVIVADHGKGVVTKRLMDGLSEMQTVVYIDPISTTPLCKNAIWVGSKSEIPDGATGTIIEKRGKDGVRFHDEMGEFTILASNTKPVDSLGAGDTFIAALAHSRHEGASWNQAVAWASYAAGVQCGRHGIVPVLLKDLPKWDVGCTE